MKDADYKIDRKKNLYYSFFPNFVRKRLKSFYYDIVQWAFYRLKWKIHYNTWDFFESIVIETTTYCNLRCKFCPNSKYDRGLLKNKKLMDINLFKKIINELSELKYNGFIALYYYGEPLTDDRLPDLIRYVKEKLPKSKVLIKSNGLLLTVELYKKLIEAGIDIIFINQYLDVMPLNVEKIFEYLKTRPKEENKIQYYIFKEDDELSNRGGEVVIKRLQERPNCAFAFENKIIDVDGNMILCCNDYHSSVKFGNLKNEKLIDIWNKPDYKKLRKELRKGIYKLPICKKCMCIE